MGNVGGLGRPRGDGAGSGGDDLSEPGDGGGGGAAGAVGEEFFEDGLLVGGERGGEIDHMDEAGGEGAHGQSGGGEVGAQFFQAKRGEGGGAAKGQHGREKPGMFRKAGGVVKECGECGGVLRFEVCEGGGKKPLTTPVFLP